ncbi:KTSC domain-containing protein [Bradyrhizobium uaiense]|uniref:KTSC domain-containing protein n=1 Tax=Bradyrhizobium uaiense TaxID=2594946 RepID=A0A6P1BBE9_9BRAD|nr:KTSC domain-containing protein [Bradyrhizobium uaiense]NEU94802.1 KTSC domain-containing protein [Bradyrhizobium uaiense]
MKPVKSSTIEAVGHDPDRKVLTVRFNSGATYTYEGVSADQHSALMGAKSVGTHFSQHIRNRFKATKA